MKNLLRHLNWIEAPFCRAANKKGNSLEIRQFFRVVSRLGDGVFWYVLMALLPILYGRLGLVTAIQMLSVGFLALVVYKTIKHITVRQRPCDFHDDIHCHGPTLDMYSFPSGHTMHAVGFTGVLVGVFPEIALLVAPFVILVAWSRLILGLHYPSDVVVGAIIGALISWLSFQVPIFSLMV